MVSEDRLNNLRQFSKLAAGAGAEIGRAHV